MKKCLVLLAIIVACAFANAQSRGGNWPVAFHRENAHAASSPQASVERYRSDGSNVKANAAYALHSAPAGGRFSSRRSSVRIIVVAYISNLLAARAALAGGPRRLTIRAPRDGSPNGVSFSGLPAVCRATS